MHDNKTVQDRESAAEQEGELILITYGHFL